MAYSDHHGTRPSNRHSIASISTISSNTSTSSSSDDTTRRSSTASTSNHHYIQPTSPRFKSQVQLVPHSRSPTLLSTPLSPTEHELLRTTTENFSELDLSSQEFDFEDVFTFDRPQRKLPSVVEVTVSTPRVLRREAPQFQQQQQQTRLPNYQRQPQQQQQHTQRDWSNFTFSHYGHLVVPPVPQPRPRLMRGPSANGAAQMYLRNQIAAGGRRK